MTALVYPMKQPATRVLLVHQGSELQQGVGHCPQPYVTALPPVERTSREDQRSNDDKRTRRRKTTTNGLAELQRNSNEWTFISGKNADRQKNKSINSSPSQNLSTTLSTQVLSEQASGKVGSIGQARKPACTLAVYFAEGSTSLDLAWEQLEKRSSDTSEFRTTEIYGRFIQGTNLFTQQPPPLRENQPKRTKLQLKVTILWTLC